MQARVGDRRRGHRAHARRRRRDRAAARRRWPSAARRRRTSWPTPQQFGPADVAREIAAVVRDHEAAGRPHDLVLLGNDAADTGDFQVGIRLAYELGRPVVNGVTQRVGVDGRLIVTAERRRARRPRDLPRAAARRGHGARGRRRAALPDGPRPDEGQEGRRSRSASPSAEPTGPSRVRLVPAARGAERRPGPRQGRRRPRPPWSTSSSSWGCWPDDPRPRREGPRGRRRRGVAARRSPSPARSPRPAAACPSTRSSWATSSDALQAGLAAYGVRDVHLLTGDGFDAFSGAAWASGHRDRARGDPAPSW